MKKILKRLREAIRTRSRITTGHGTYLRRQHFLWYTLVGEVNAISGPTAEETNPLAGHVTFDLNVAPRLTKSRILQWVKDDNYHNYALEFPGASDSAYLFSGRVDDYLPTAAIDDQRVGDLTMSIGGPVKQTGDQQEATHNPGG